MVKDSCSSSLKRFFSFVFLKSTLSICTSVMLQKKPPHEQQQQYREEFTAIGISIIGVVVVTECCWCNAHAHGMSWCEILSARYAHLLWIGVSMCVCFFRSASCGKATICNFVIGERSTNSSNAKHNKRQLFSKRAMITKNVNLCARTCTCCECMYVWVCATTAESHQIRRNNQHSTIPNNHLIDFHEIVISSGFFSLSATFLCLKIHNSWPLQNGSTKQREYFAGYIIFVSSF